MRAFAHDVHTYPLPPGHRFPLPKYRLVRTAVDHVAGVQVTPSRRVTWRELRAAHTTPYLARVRSGRLGRRELLGLGLPWSPQLVERARRAVGATMQAAEAALEHGVSANLGGGTHHAFADAGRGYCVFNDVVTARRTLCDRAERVLVVDLDVHQGDGTHALLLEDPEAFTFSINGFRNYPFKRVPGDLELDLPDGTGDERYLSGLAKLLPRAVARSRPTLCFYLAGADPYVGDRLGRLALTKAGSRNVTNSCATRSRPPAFPSASRSQVDMRIRSRTRSRSTSRRSGRSTRDPANANRPAIGSTSINNFAHLSYQLASPDRRPGTFY